MSDWPAGVTVGPIRDWPGALTPWWTRKTSPFGADLTTTLRQMDREVAAITETTAQRHSVELLVAIPAAQFRLDGKPRARATADHPGVILSLDSVHGHLAYPADRFVTWEANLRAIVLALEALRKVDRYGVTAHGEQYRGFLALEAPSKADALESAYAAVALIALSDVPSVRSAPTVHVSRAKRNAHPDRGGTSEQWRVVVEAERVLREAGRL